MNTARHVYKVAVLQFLVEFEAQKLSGGVVATNALESVGACACILLVVALSYEHKFRGNTVSGS